jgi:large subunit ribosomal protein L29
MKIKEIRDLSVQDLAARKHELREESFHLRIQQQSGQLEKPSQLREIRREIARLETVLHEKTSAKAETKAETTTQPKTKSKSKTKASAN